MLTSFLTATDIFNEYQEIRQYLSADFDINVTINTSIDDLKLELKNRNYQIRTLMPKLDITTTSIIDNLERDRLVIYTTNTNFVFNLFGSNDNITFVNCANVAVTKAGEYNIRFSDLYLYYKAETIYTNTTAYLIESWFDNILKELVLAKLFKRFQARASSNFADKADYHMQMYFNKLDSLNISVDSNNDGVEDKIIKSRVIDYVG